MDFSCDTKTLGPKPCAAIAVGVFEEGRLGPAAADLDQRSGGSLRRLMAEGAFEGRSGQSLSLFHQPHIAPPRVLLIGCGKEQDFSAGVYLEAVGRAVRIANDLGADSLCCTLTELPVTTRTPEWNVRTATEAAEAVLYRFDRLKSKPANGRRTLKEIHFTAPALTPEPAARALRQGRGIAEGVRFMRDLANLPGNHCTPTYLAEQAQALGQQYGLKVNVLEEADMQALGMGALLSVSRGSRQPPKLITVAYQGSSDAPVVLVGKGITFDSGGISIKPAANMDEMKFDMSGAASVLGTLKAVAEIGLKLHVIGVIPTCENMPDGNASKPGDVVTTLSGQTVEVLNTDAEGRLILCDALTYAERFEPAAVVDIATLTGACVIALGAHAAGLLTPDDGLAEELLAAGEAAYDRAWRLPLWDDYQKQLESNFADMANIGGREGGTITAACFLARFTKKFRWAHLDIAGVAYRGGKEKGSTGRPVGLLAQFLIRRSEQDERR